MRVSILIFSLVFCILFSLASVANEPKQEAKPADHPLTAQSAIQTFLEGQRRIRTLSVSYEIKANGKKDSKERVVAKCHLDWDIPNNRYYFIEVAMHEDPYSPFKIGGATRRNAQAQKGPETLLYKVDEHFLKDGRYTFIRSYLADPNSLKLGKKEIYVASISGEEKYYVPFRYPFDFMGRFERFPITLSAENPIIKQEDAHVVNLIFSKEIPIKKNNFLQTVFNFQQNTGLVLKRVEKVVDEKQNLIAFSRETELPLEKYTSVNGVPFPREIKSRIYRDGTLFGGGVYDFSDDIKINEKIPEERFVPVLPVGTRVDDVLQKKSYIISEAEGAPSNEGLVKRLDELFEKIK
jgi:hypothetical protein